MEQRTLIKELRNGATISEVCTKHNISFEYLFGILKKNRIPLRKRDEINENIYQVGKRWEIRKNVNGKMCIFGSYLDFEEARSVRNTLKKMGWNVNPLDYLGDMYIHKTNKKWTVSKTSGRRLTTVYGRYETKDDARKVRDCLARLNWDKDCLDLICRHTGVRRVNGN